jgi:hypothetical protein
LCAAASQWGFFYETGGELQWRDAGSFAGDEEGLKVLLSGSSAVLASSVVIIIVAWFAKDLLYRAVGGFACWLGALAYAGTCLLAFVLFYSGLPRLLPRPDAHVVVVVVVL